MRPPSSGAIPVATFTPNNMSVLPVIDRKPVVNEAVWQFDYNGDEYRSKPIYVEGSSISQFGRGDQWTVESQGLFSELGAWSFSQWVSHRLFARFAGTPAGLKGGAPTLEVEAFYMLATVWVGDYVAVTHPKMPDILTGALGVTDRIYEVIDRQPDYAGACMRFTLLDTGLTGAVPSEAWDAIEIGSGKWY